MEKEDVIRVLGTPKKVAARQTEKGLEEKYSYWGLSRLAYSYALVDNEMVSQDRLYITLLNNKLVEWGDKYDPSTIMDKSLQITSETAKQYSNMYQKQLDLQKDK